MGAKVELLAGDLDAARERLVEGYRVGVATKDLRVVAGVGVRLAIFAVALERSRGRGRGSPNLVALRANVVTQVGAPTFEAAYRWSRSMDRENAIARLDPAPLEL